MLTTVKELRKKRASYKAKLTQFKKYLDSISTCEKLNTEEYQERECFEQLYFSTIASARVLLSQNTPAEQADSLLDIESMPKESSAALRALIDTINKNLRALNTLNIKTENWDVLIIHQDLPTLDKFITFLKGQAELLESVEHTNAKRRHSEP
ncbi:Gag-pol polyprotein, partial [Operophtera brumata]